jgi:hypothetical protein
MWGGCCTEAAGVAAGSAQGAALGRWVGKAWACLGRVAWEALFPDHWRARFTCPALRVLAATNSACRRGSQLLYGLLYVACLRQLSAGPDSDRSDAVRAVIDMDMHYGCRQCEV